MVDATGVLDESAPTNTFLSIMFGTVVLVMGAIILFGFQLQDLGVVITGLVFLALPIAADYYSNGRIIRSPGSFSALSAGYWLPVAFVAVVAAEVAFSFFSAPSGSYLSAPLANTPSVLQTLVNVWLAPIVENVLAISLTIVIYEKVMRGFLGLPRIVSALTAAVPAAIAFTFLHGVRDPNFRLLAFLVLMVMLVPLFLEDALPGPQVPYIPISITFTIGVHRMVNIANFGGYVPFVAEMASAEAPLVYATGLVLVFEAVTFLAFIVWMIRLGLRLSPS